MFSYHQHVHDAHLININFGNKLNSYSKFYKVTRVSFTLFRRGPVVGHSLWTRPARVQSPWEARIIRCKNLALYIRDCESLCLSDETVNAVGPFYLVSGEVKDPTQGVNV